VALGQVFFPSQHFGFHLSSSFHRSYKLIHTSITDARQHQQPSALSNATLQLTTITSNFPPVFLLCGRSAKQAVTTLNKPTASGNQQLSDKIITLDLQTYTKLECWLKNVCGSEGSLLRSGYCGCSEMCLVTTEQ